MLAVMNSLSSSVTLVSRNPSWEHHRVSGSLRDQNTEIQPTESKHVRVLWFPVFCSETLPLTLFEFLVYYFLFCFCSPFHRCHASHGTRPLFCISPPAPPWCTCVFDLCPWALLFLCHFSTLPYVPLSHRSCVPRLTVLWLPAHVWDFRFCPFWLCSLIWTDPGSESGLTFEPWNVLSFLNVWTVTCPVCSVCLWVHLHTSCFWHNLWQKYWTSVFLFFCFFYFILTKTWLEDSKWSRNAIVDYSVVRSGHWSHNNALGLLIPKSGLANSWWDWMGSNSESIGIKIKWKGSLGLLSALIYTLWLQLNRKHNILPL